MRRMFIMQTQSSISEFTVNRELLADLSFGGLGDEKNWRRLILAVLPPSPLSNPE